MCGLVGAFNLHGLNNFQLDAFRWLLHFCPTRGEDSTGVATRITDRMGRKGRVTVHKAEGLPANLWLRFPDFFDPIKGLPLKSTSEEIRFLMGHCRAATRGLVTVENAHPFMHGDIVGTHNGTINTGLVGMPNSEKLGTTDSERMFYAMSQGWSLQQIVDEVNGAIAFAWYNMKDKTFNIFRNKERTLYYAEHGTAVYYASEDWMLEQALRRSRNPEVVSSIKLLPEDMWLSWDTSKTTLFLAKESTEVKKKKWSYTTTTTTSSTSTTGSNTVVGLPVTVGNKPATTPARPATAQEYATVFSQGKKQPQLLGNLQDLENKTGWLKPVFADEEEFKKVCRFGCAYCESPLKYADYLLDEIKFMEPKTPLCSDCVTLWSH